MIEARRYNKGKLRYELLPSNALQDIVEVYTKGAEKYTIRNENSNIIDDGANNWRKGLSWTDMLGSIQRHLESFKSGEDIDLELGTKHLANAAWGIMGLLEFYRIYPQGDDRLQSYKRFPKIGLDIDEVICDWVGTWTKKFGHDIPEVWNFSYGTYDKFKSIPKDELEQFYLDIPPKISPSDIPFEPHCYITSRSVPVELTKAWIEKHKFPTVPVYSVGFGVSKVEVAKESGIDIFVDDRYENFVELNKAGICTFLLDAAHNRRYQVGYKRVMSLKELFNRFK